MKDVLLRPDGDDRQTESESYPEFHMTPSPLPSGSAGKFGEGDEDIRPDNIVEIFLTKEAQPMIRIGHMVTSQIVITEYPMGGTADADDF